MSDVNDQERVRRIGVNEALFRQVNERIEDLNDALTRLIYEQTRKNATWFFVKPGHEVDDVERVVERDDRFWIVEKRPGVAAEIAARTNRASPRVRRARARCAPTP